MLQQWSTYGIYDTILEVTSIQSKHYSVARQLIDKNCLVLMYVCMHAFWYVLGIYVCSMYVCIRICLCVFMHARRYACM